MENTDYSFMQTGNNINTDTPHDPELVLQVSSIVTAFVSNAIELAAEYIKHAGRNVVLTEDIKLCMKLETFKFLEDDNTNKIQQCRSIIQEDMRRELNGRLSESEEDEEDGEDEEDEEDTFTHSKCTCELCISINTINEKWMSWEPQTPLEKSLKKNIDGIPDTDP